MIIPTTCEASRKQAIQRAIARVLSQDAARDLIVVVNGDGVDQRLLRCLSAIPAFRVLQHSKWNVPGARWEGLDHCRGDYFCLLDDDDELVPQSLSRRITLFCVGVHLVVTNGSERDSEDKPLVPASAAAEVNDEQVGSSLWSNWLASPGPLFSAASVEEHIFGLSIQYYERTYPFFRLIAMERPFATTTASPTECTKAVPGQRHDRWTTPLPTLQSCANSCGFPSSRSIEDS